MKVPAALSCPGAASLVLACIVLLMSGVMPEGIAEAQQYYAQQGAPVQPPVTGNWSYQEGSQAYNQSGNDMIFGVAAFKICQIKSFLFAAVYILGAIAFVVFAIRALFTKFEVKQFIPILGALFVVASADLFIAFMSESAYYCPTVLSTF